MRYILKRYPYESRILHEIKPQDPQQKIHFDYFILYKISDDEEWIHKILWSGESHLSFSGSVNTHNCGLWGSSNHYALHEKPLNEYITHWCRTTEEFVIRHFCFESATSKGVVRTTVPSLNYNAMLQN